MAVTTATDLYYEVSGRIGRTESPLGLDKSYPLNKQKAKEQGWGEYQGFAEPTVDLKDLVDIDWSRNHVVKNRYRAGVLASRQVGMVDIDFGICPDFANHVALPTRDVHDVIARVSRLVELVWRDEYFAGFCPERLFSRVYETVGGCRVLLVPNATGMADEFTPEGQLFQRIAKNLGCDPLYQQLCKEQRTWRMRIGAKPWRESEYAPIATFHGQFPDSAYSVEPCEDAMKVVEFHDAMVLNPPVSY